MIMKCLNLQDYQAKIQNYRKGFTYLENSTSTNQNQTSHSQRNEKVKYSSRKKIGDHPTKKRMEEWRVIESTETQGLKWQ